MPASIRPRAITKSAYGILGVSDAMSRARNAKSVHIQLSAQPGFFQCRGSSRLDPAEMTRERPAPTCIPLTTATGTTRENHLNKPVILKMSTRPLTKRPADAVSAFVYELAMAILAIAFIGCTGRGMPKARPVAMFARPENTRVDVRLIEPVSVNAIINGKSVPRSPNEPDSSARGCLRSVCRLYALLRRRWVKASEDIMAAKYDQVGPEYGA